LNTSRLSPFYHLLRLFFPHICAGCGADGIPQNAQLCLTCLHELPFTQFHWHANNPVEKIFWGRLPIVAASSLCFFTKDTVVQRLLHQLKYKGHQEIGVFLGGLLGQQLKESHRFSTVEALVPLPLFAKREKQRGYNQALAICTGLATILQCPIVTDAVVRLQTTETQTQKSRVQRWENMQDRFRLNNHFNLENKHVLLVDDVVTTGASLEACGQALLGIQQCRLSIATLAFTS
jgi:ComF family protein